MAHPIELLKGTSMRLSCRLFVANNLIVNLQLQRQRDVLDRQFKGPIDCFKKVVKANGILGLWRGFAGSLAFRSNFFFLFVGIPATSVGVVD